MGRTDVVGNKDYSEDTGLIINEDALNHKEIVKDGGNLHITPSGKVQTFIIQKDDQCGAEIVGRIYVDPLVSD